MTLKDHRGYEISGATPAARDAFEHALALFQSWRSGAEAQLALALQDAPSFTMAHVLHAYLCLCSRDVARVKLARSARAQASVLRANARERLHIAAIGAALADDMSLLRSLLGTLLRQYPRDVLALQVGHAFDYMSGDTTSLRERIAIALPAWAADMPGYHAVLAMQAFSLVESGQYQSAADTALRALTLNPFDARAHHALTHVYEMTENPAAGARWMRERVAFWAENTTVATHCWWHWALFHLAQDELDAALALYDERIRACRSPELADMIDASALLWRLQMLGAEVGTRWQELARAWAPHISDGYCTFSDLHAALAFVGANDWQCAQRLEFELLQQHNRATRYGETTRLVGLPACRAIIAFGRGDYVRSVELLGALPAIAHRIGGSHAQRDVLYLTLLEAVQRLRRPQLRIAA